MRKTLITLMALTGVATAASGDVILSQDFRNTGKLITISKGQSGTYDNVTWLAGAYNNKSTGIAFGANGMYVQGQNWNKSWASTTLDTALTMGVEASYEVSYTMTPGGKSGAMNFALVGTGADDAVYSLVFGTGYQDSPNFQVGYLTQDITSAGSFKSFESGLTTLTGIDTTTTAPKLHEYNGSYTVDMVLTNGNVAIEVAYGDKTYTNTYAYSLPENFSFNKLVYMFDGADNTGASALQSVSVSTTPEPTTATLSLLARAGLAARRRRK